VESEIALHDVGEMQRQAEEMCHKVLQMIEALSDLSSSVTTPSVWTPLF
jgi:hypothetical protein